MGLAEKLAAKRAAANPAQEPPAEPKKTGAQAILEGGVRARVEAAEQQVQELTTRCAELESAHLRDQALISELQAKGTAGGPQLLDPNTVERSRFYNRTPQSFDPERNPEFASLVQSIRRTGGNVDPGMVRRRPDGGLELVFGDRRCSACRIAGMPFKAIIAEDLSDEQLLHYRIVENRDREDVSSWAMSRQALVAVEISGEEEAGKKFLEASGYAHAQVFRLLKIATLPIELEKRHPNIDAVSYRTLLGMANRLEADPQGFKTSLRALTDALTVGQANDLMLGREKASAAPAPHTLVVRKTGLKLNLTCEKERAEAIAKRVSMVLEEFGIHV